MRLTYFSHADTLFHLVHTVGLPASPLVRQQRPSTLPRIEDDGDLLVREKLRAQLGLCQCLSAVGLSICGLRSCRGLTMANPCSVRHLRCRPRRPAATFTREAALSNLLSLTRSRSDFSDLAL